MQKPSAFLERVQLGKLGTKAQKAFELLLTSNTATRQERLDAMKEIAEVASKFYDLSDKQLAERQGLSLR